MDPMVLGEKYPSAGSLTTPRELHPTQPNVLFSNSNRGNEISSYIGNTPPSTIRPQLSAPPEVDVADSIIPTPINVLRYIPIVNEYIIDADKLNIIITLLEIQKYPTLLESEFFYKMDISFSESKEVQELKQEYNRVLAYDNRKIKEALDYLIEYMPKD
jgi:hypothetical protein